MLGGDLKLDAELARKAIEEKMAKPLGLWVKDAALGILKIINYNMALAIRSNSVARGIDPRDFSIMPFGGAGPLHGVALAEAVSAKDVIVPVAPGITAAVGLLKSDLRYEHTEAVPRRARRRHRRRTRPPQRRRREAAQRAWPRSSTPTGSRAPTRDRDHRRMPLSRPGLRASRGNARGPVTQENKSVIAESFHAQHQLDYGYSYPEQEVEVITLRAIGSAAMRPDRRSRRSRDRRLEPGPRADVCPDHHLR